MVIFSHRAIGFGKKENSIEAINAAIRDGFSVELDLRLNGDTIILSHEAGENSSDSEFDRLLEIIKDNQDILFALHLKEDSKVLFHKVGEAIRHLKNCFLFVTDFNQGDFIKEMSEVIGSERLALYIADKKIDPLLADKVDYFWLDETMEPIYQDLGYFGSFHKKVICCSPELFSQDYKKTIESFNERVYAKEGAFGICTDFAIRCPVCLSMGHFTQVEEVNDYTILRCHYCGLEFARTMRYDSMYYEKMHYAEDYNLNAISLLSREDFLKKAERMLHDPGWVPHNIVFKWIEKNFKKGSTVLDLGCGVGLFLGGLESRGFKAIGIEVSTKVVEMLKAKGFRAYLGPFENINNTDIGQPDLVVLLGVIEHVENPVRLLRRIHCRFPRASLLISIPSPRRWDFAIGIRNYWDYPPNHLTPFWSEKSLEIALRKAGFDLQEWVFPEPITAELWFVFLDLLFYRLGMRRKGYFMGLTNKVDTSHNLFKDAVKLCYPLLKKVNFITNYIAEPFLEIMVRNLRSKGYSGLSAFAVANPVLT